MPIGKRVSSALGMVVGGTRTYGAPDGQDMTQISLEPPSSKIDLEIRATLPKSATNVRKATYKVKDGIVKKRKETSNTDFVTKYCAIVPHAFLYYFDSQESSKPKGTIDLQHYDSVEVDRNNPLRFALKSLHFEDLKELHFEVEYEEDVVQWIKAINESKYQAILEGRDQYKQINDSVQQLLQDYQNKVKIESMKNNELQQDNLEKSQKYSALLDSFTKQLEELDSRFSNRGIIEYDVSIPSSSKSNLDLSCGVIEREDEGDHDDKKKEKSQIKIDKKEKNYLNGALKNSVTTISSNYLSLHYQDFEDRLNSIVNSFKEYKKQKEFEYQKLRQSEESKIQEGKELLEKVKELEDTLREKDQNTEVLKISIKDREEEIQKSANNKTQEMEIENARVTKELQEMKLMYDAENMEALNEIKVLTKEKKILVEEIKRSRDDIKKDKRKNKKDLLALAAAFNDLKNENSEMKKRLEDAENLLLLSVHKEDMLALEQKYKEEICNLLQKIDGSRKKEENGGEIEKIINNDDENGESTETLSVGKDQIKSKPVFEVGSENNSIASMTSEDKDSNIPEKGGISENSKTIFDQYQESIREKRRYSNDCKSTPDRTISSSKERRNSGQSSPSTGWMNIAINPFEKNRSIPVPMTTPGGTIIGKHPQEDNNNVDGNSHDKSGQTGSSTSASIKYTNWGGIIKEQIFPPFSKMKASNENITKGGKSGIVFDSPEVLSPSSLLGRPTASSSNWSEQSISNEETTVKDQKINQPGINSIGNGLQRQQQQDKPAPNTSTFSVAVPSIPASLLVTTKENLDANQNNTIEGNMDSRESISRFGKIPGPSQSNELHSFKRDTEEDSSSSPLSLQSIAQNNITSPDGSNPNPPTTNITNASQIPQFSDNSSGNNREIYSQKLNLVDYNDNRTSVRVGSSSFTNEHEKRPSNWTWGFPGSLSTNSYNTYPRQQQSVVGNPKHSANLTAQDKLSNPINQRSMNNTINNTIGQTGINDEKSEKPGGRNALQLSRSSIARGFDGMVSGMKTIVNAVDPFENTPSSLASKYNNISNSTVNHESISEEHEEEVEGEEEVIETKKITRQLRSSSTRGINKGDTGNINPPRVNEKKRITFDSLRSPAPNEQKSTQQKSKLDTDKTLDALKAKNNSLEKDSMLSEGNKDSEDTKDQQDDRYPLTVKETILGDDESKESLDKIRVERENEENQSQQQSMGTNKSTDSDDDTLSKPSQNQEIESILEEPSWL